MVDQGCFGMWISAPEILREEKWPRVPARAREVGVAGDGVAAVADEREAGHYMSPG
jgi:hypothetical protein